MGVATGFLVEDAFAVEGVDAHLAGGVDDAAVAEADADMDDAAVGVVEEGKVVAVHIVLLHHSFGAVPLPLTRGGTE